MEPTCPPGAADAERAAAFLLERVRATRGRMWDQGARPAPAEPPAGAALRVFATRRVRGIPELVADGLLAWARAGRPGDLVAHIPGAREILQRQSLGRRCVSLIDDAQ